MGKGRRYELETKNGMNSDTRQCVKAHRPDFSGNSKGEVADIMVVWQDERYKPQRPSGHPERHVIYLELKKCGDVPEGNRKVVMDGSSQGQNGREELEDLVNGSPSWSEQYVVFKFPQRAPIILDATVLLHWIRREDEGWGHNFLGDDELPMYDACDQHGTRLTNGDNISVVKPELDYWESSRSARPDHIEILDAIGVEPYYWTEGY